MIIDDGKRLNVKPATTHKQQLSILKSRGLIVENEDAALKVLECTNYYRLADIIFICRKRILMILKME